ncbi:MAG TPA: signal peptidase I [Methanocella sp.]|nr:signal peptidase I [Methanocella sp.]
MSGFADRFLMGTLFLIAALAIALFLAPYVGIRVDTVLSGSMTPAFRAGDLVIIGTVAPENVQVGDVIAFTTDKGLVCHRVDAILEGPLRFRTKGDANDGPDFEPVTASQLEGKVLFSLPALGRFSGFARSPAGLIFLIGLPLTLIAGIEIIGRWGNEDDQDTGGGR